MVSILSVAIGHSFTLTVFSSTATASRLAMKHRFPFEISLPIPVHIKDFKSHWYYWHTGHKFIAILSMMVSTLIMSVFLVFFAGFSIWGIIFAVLLDAAGFWLAIVYLFFIRFNITEFIGLQSSVDTLVVNQLVVPMLIGFFVARISSFSIAKICSSRQLLRD
jgi:hypothetical protein